MRIWPLADSHTSNAIQVTKIPFAQLLHCCTSPQYGTILHEVSSLFDSLLSAKMANPFLSSTACQLFGSTISRIYLVGAAGLRQSSVWVGSCALFHMRPSSRGLHIGGLLQRLSHVGMGSKLLPQRDRLSNLTPATLRDISVLYSPNHNG